MEVVDELIDIIIQDEYEDECSENIEFSYNIILAA